MTVSTEAGGWLLIDVRQHGADLMRRVVDATDDPAIASRWIGQPEEVAA